MNAKSYVLLGFVIVLVGAAACIAVIKLMDIPKPLAVGMLTGALTSTCLLYTSLAEIEPVGVPAQLVAGQLYLHAAALLCQGAGPLQQLPSQAPVPVAAVHRQLHYLRYLPRMMQLLLKAQVQHPHTLPVPCLLYTSRCV